MNVRTLIGESVHRAEDFRFLKGAGSFVDDLKREGCCTPRCCGARWPMVASGGSTRGPRVALPGVHAVVTAAEIGDVPVIPLRLANLPEFKAYLQPVIAKDKVRYVGEPVAVVVAETHALAEDALEKVELDIESLPALPDRHAAAHDKSALFDGVSNRAVRYVASFGDAQAAFTKAEYTRKETFRCHRLTGLAAGDPWADF
jgi:carbon-monoxide dehydrogenase large subunit